MGASPLIPAGCSAHLQASLVRREDGGLGIALLLNLVVPARQGKRPGEGFGATQVLLSNRCSLRCIQACCT